MILNERTHNMRVCRHRFIHSKIKLHSRFHLFCLPENRNSYPLNDLMEARPDGLLRYFPALNHHLYRLLLLLIIIIINMVVVDFGSRIAGF